ncbi:MAG: response regulator [Luteitalea sp.]|nr:response regulator [Luteitalea sp.]
MIRVCVVEDQTLVRQGIHTLLDLVDDIEVIAEARDGEEALEVIPRVKPDVVLLDMYLPKRSGLDVLNALQWSNALPPTLILTTFDEDHLVIGGLRAGARGFLLKDVSLEQLTTAIRRLASGGTLVQPALTARLRQQPPRVRCDFPSLPSPDPLSGRELEILRLMARGYSNREIAEALTITEGTVKNHVSVILSKMGVRDRTRAVLKALEAGVLE